MFIVAVLLEVMHSDTYRCKGAGNRCLQPFHFHFPCNQGQHQHDDVQAADGDKHGAPAEAVLHKTENGSLMAAPI